mgnify:CR=1 FL=1
MGLFSKTIEEDADERGRVFAWAKEKRVWMHLAAFLLFSVIIHGSGFYLFKVVYPSPVRVEPKPDAIQVIENDDPAARALLQRLADRTIYLSPPSAQSEVRPGLESGKIHFAPAFQRTELELLPPASLEANTGLEGPGPEGPGLEGSLASALPSTRPIDARIFVKVDPSLVDRPLAPWSLLHDYLGLAGTIPAARLEITISPGGEVEVAGVDGPMDSSGKEELATVVESTLRFVPASDSAKGWIELSVGVDPAP